MKKQFLFVLLVALTLVACGKKATIVTPEQLEGRWLLKTIEGVKVPETGTIDKPYMEYNLVENRFSCFVGCNRMGGNLKFENGTISLKDAYSTKMLCHNEEAMKLENRLGMLLEQVDSVVLKGDVLVLSSKDGKELLTMERE